MNDEWFTFLPVNNTTSLVRPPFSNKLKVTWLAKFLSYTLRFNYLKSVEYQQVCGVFKFLIQNLVLQLLLLILIYYFITIVVV